MNLPPVPADPTVGEGQFDPGKPPPEKDEAAPKPEKPAEDFRAKALRHGPGGGKG